MSYNLRGRIFVSIALFVAIESILRLIFFYLGTFSGYQLITPSPPAFVMGFINGFSLALGIVGLLVIPGLMFYRAWGYWGTLMLCIVTIGFDGWAVATVTWTASAGLLIPIVALIYLIGKHNNFPISKPLGR
jgi:hypothetical protein